MPRRRPWSSRLWAPVVLLVLAPVVLMTLVPMAFGLERYVISGTDMDGPLARGAVAFERRVPIGDVEVGDVVTYSTGGLDGASADGPLTTRRVTRIHHGSLYTRGDRTPEAAEDVLTAVAHPTVARVVRSVPYIGYPFLGALAQPGWALLLVLLGTGLGLASVQVGGARGHRLAAGTS